MSEGFERLKQIGSERIHKETHISLKHLDAMLNEDFSSITRVQFLGFISILEREYHIDLSDYKENSLALLVDNSPYSSSESHLFVVAKKQTNYTPLYIFITFIIFASVAYMSIDLAPSQESFGVEDNNVIKEAKKIVENKIQTREIEIQKEQDTAEKNLQVASQEIKEVEEIPLDEKIEEEKVVDNKELEEKESTPVVEKSEQELFIAPKSKVWLGYIDLKSGKKKSLTVKESFNIKLKNDFLFMFGHGRVDLKLDDTEYHFKTAKTLRLLYKDRKLTKISAKEFKALNKGKKW